MKSSKYSEISFIFNLQTQSRSAAHKSVISKDYNDPESITTLIEDDRYWVNGTGINAWEGQDFNIAVYLGDNIWRFEEVNLGDISFVEDRNNHYYYNGSSLVEYGSESIINHASTHEPNGGDQLTQFDGGIF